MTPEQIYTVAKQAGFPPETAVKMVAIAIRESSGNPMAFNGKPPDRSYGLWQINMLGVNGPFITRVLGLTSEQQLFDPLTNARAAYALWGGNDNNLNIAWAINKAGSPYHYAEKYQANLIIAQQAALNVEGGGAGGGDGSGGVQVASGSTGTPPNPTRPRRG